MKLTGLTEGSGPQLLRETWPAWWIAHPAGSPFDFGVCHFRKSFDLPAAPASFTVHISADNRYRLFVNGTPVCTGPAQSDLRNWRYETIDLSPHLKAGRNVLAAVVWNFGEHRPMAQISHRTAFILRGDGEAEKVANTDTTWRALQSQAYQPNAYRDNDERLGWQYFVAGAMERVDAARYPWGWEAPEYDDATWTPAAGIDRGAPAGIESHQKWMLVPRPTPLLVEHSSRFIRVARANVPVAPGFPAASQHQIIPPRTSASILLDHGRLTAGYPTLTLSGGQGAEIRLVYAEALCDDQRKKGDRNQIDGKKLAGIADIFLPDGGPHRRFRPLWLRNFRWLQLDITTADQPLVIEDIRHDEPRMPTPRFASFSCDRPAINAIWDVAWRTLELGAHETFVSDLYWERIQCIGDTMVQALAWLHTTGDDALVRQAIEQFDQSRVPWGLTQSRYPCDLEQFTPLYSLMWIWMVHDYAMHRGDEAFVQRMLPGIRQVLTWYADQLKPDGLLPPLCHLDFVDSGYFGQRKAILADDPHSSMTIHSLFLVIALDRAADLSGDEGYRTSAAAIKERIRAACWDESRALFADTPARKHFSQHANILAILANVLPPDQQPALLQRTLADTSILPVELYFRFFLARAMKKTGLGDLYIDNLGPWERMVRDGMTTFGETDKEPRSECHPWSASPAYELLATVAGIAPAAPGFASVRIAPALGPLNHVKATLPHPRGTIEVELQRTPAGGLRASLRLPPGLPGTFCWQGHEIPLASSQELTFE